MSYAERHEVTLVTDSGGDAEGYTPVITGKIHTIIYTKTDYDAGVDLAITAETSLEGLWTESNVNVSATRAPRQPTHDAVGVASLFAGAGEPVEDGIVLAKDRVKIVVSNGGNVKTGKFTVIVT